jgi:hypothetical protein
MSSRLALALMGVLWIGAGCQSPERSSAPPSAAEPATNSDHVDAHDVRPRADLEIGAVAATEASAPNETAPAAATIVGTTRTESSAPPSDRDARAANDAWRAHDSDPSPARSSSAQDPHSAPVASGAASGEAGRQSGAQAREQVGAIAPVNASANAATDAEPGDGPLRLNRGEGFPSIVIPRDEQLFYGVSINLRLLGDLTVGQVILSSGVETYVPPLPLPGERAPVANGREVAWIHSLASGYYLGYRLVHNLDVRLLPQDWPSVYYRDTQNGTENRRSELKIGRRDGELVATYLKDGHCQGCNNPEHFVKGGFMWHKLEHCKKCKMAEHRVWKETESRTVPPGTSDLLSAVFLARTMVQDGASEISFPVVNEQTLWLLTVKAGKHKHVTTSAGKFDCVLITLATAVPPGETRDEKSFAGLFGIRGDIRIWMDAKTGVPVVIQGDLPVPVLGKLEVNVELERYSGTSPDFSPMH